MTTEYFPDLDPQSFAATRDALHAYARVLGDWTKSCRPRRKHWWHASLRPSLNGLTTGVIHAGIDFELELNLRAGLLLGRTSTGDQWQEGLRGQSATMLAAQIQEFLIAAGIDNPLIPEAGHHDTNGFPGYSVAHAASLAQVLNSVAASMATFRAGIREETSPIQLWPHHFDVSMLWLPGEKIPGQDSREEESSDKQMNFGFTFGDDGIPEPYFYITAYPWPDTFPGLQLPAGARWHAEGFSGAVLPYQSLIKNRDPDACLLDLWGGLLSAGREHMLENTI
jgi:hypothetical protein